ncbi:MAG: hypothetical protein Roseis2KO_50280 [Roseivirga sp.]
MKYFLILTLFIFSICHTQGQERIYIDASNSCSFSGSPLSGNIYSFKSSIEAIQIVDAIVDLIGLKRNFEIRAGNVENASATILPGANGTYDRYIIYSQSFMSNIINQTNSYWSAIGIMAHEVAHHLNGHTLKGGSKPPTELEADEFAGFIMSKMGATLQEAQTMFNNRMLYQPFESATHPATSARLEAIAVGWQRAREKKRPEGDITRPVTGGGPKPASASFNNVWVTHNMFLNGQLGMNIHVKFGVSNMKGINGACGAFFYYANGQKLMDFNQNYRASDGQVMVTAPITPIYDHALFEDLVIFMPYSELHMQPGTHALKMKLSIFSSPAGAAPRELAQSLEIPFTYTN